MASANQGQLIIYQKYVDTVEYSYNLLAKYPKSEKFTMVAQIKDSMLTAIKLILRANKVYNNHNARLELLNAIDAEISIQKVFVRMSHKLRYISNNNYMEWSRRLDELGRLLGGWIKTTVGKDL
ncbi:MAG: diversity-generating retroelement protein Avd [Desulfitobacteriaceae bacterium]|nr:diversity-generating retroelement protein Avd [Desulfitobacteriaceae bacterium]